MNKARTLKTSLGMVLVSFFLFVVLINVLPNLWFKTHLNRNWHVPEIGESRADTAGNTARLSLVLALDGVPFDVMEELHREGYFGGFHAPGRLVSTFPSLTRPGFSRMLVGGRPFGYERLYFDTQENQVKGFHLVQKILSTAKEHLDYHPRLHFLGFPGYIAYVFPDKFTQTAIESFKERVLSFEGTEFVAYIGLTDAIAHVDGRSAQKEFLKQIGSLLHEIRRELDDPLDVIVFSDHGNNMTENSRVDLSTVLVDNGYRDANALNDPKDFVLARNGFVSFAAVYTAPENAHDIATLFATLEGVDFSVYLSHDSVMVNGPSGVARIEHDNGGYRYTPLEGDPLDLAGIVHRLSQDGQTDRRGFVQADDWWHATRAHTYPDPLRRIWRGLHDLVEHPATILVSFKDGYAFGPLIFSQEIVSGRKGTHGALLANHSNGFFMTDFKPVAPYNRPEVVAELLRGAATAKQRGEQAGH